MRSRLIKSRKSSSHTKSASKPENTTNKDHDLPDFSRPSLQLDGPSHPPDGPRTPGPAKQTPSLKGVFGSVSPRRNEPSTLSPSTPSSHATPTTMVQTIRTVPSLDAPSDTDNSSDAPSRRSDFSSSVNSNASGVTMSSNQDKAPDGRFGSEASNGDATIRAPTTESSTKQEADEIPAGVESPNPGAWDSTIGKAGLGKTGRVINKLVSDNDALKREIQLERLRADEAKREAKVAEERMDRMISDHESQLLEASVNKTLLSRKERQVESLTASVEQEKRRTTEALERESSWRTEMEKMRSSTSRQVDDANNHAALMEGRYNAISSHWRDQGDEVKRAHLKIRGDIAGLVEERRSDDEKIATLRDLCDQQDGNIRELRQQRDDIQKQFEAYKRQQEEALADIKRMASLRDEEQQKMLEEAREVLAKLKWSLNVKENVRGAG